MSASIESPAPPPIASAGERTGRRSAADAARNPVAVWRRVAPGVTLAALRVIAALVLLQHGTQKIFGFPANPARPWGGPPDLLSRSWIAGILELIGGVLLVLGLFTRPVAFVLSGLMAFAYFIAHAPRSFYPVVNGGEPAVLLCFVFLYLAAVGAGPLSLDGTSRDRGPGA